MHTAEELRRKTLAHRQETVRLFVEQIKDRFTVAAEEAASNGQDSIHFPQARDNDISAEIIDIAVVRLAEDADFKTFHVEAGAAAMKPKVIISWADNAQTVAPES